MHRIWGHREIKTDSTCVQGFQISGQSDNCAACVYEFNIADDIRSSPYIPVLESENCVLVLRHDSQIQENTFSYTNLRAPPQI